mgnify:CR=1 FL=1
MKSNELLEKKELREKVISRVDVLDKVGNLLLLPNTEYATTEQVAKYYKVGKEAIKTIVFNHNDELKSDGYKLLSGKDTKEFLVSCNLQPTNHRGYFVAAGQKFANKNNGLFPKRAILRVGMLLRDSEIAKEIRTRLLDIVHDTEKEKPEIIQNVVNEISEEKQLMLERVEAEMNGDYDKVSVINAKLFALKNKRIAELEKENKIIKTHSLTIIESRDVINRLVRKIAMENYNANFGRAYNELYSKVNYKLGINIKARNKKKGKSLLHTLTKEETFEVEKIVRAWAVKVGLDVEKLLKIA